MISSLLNHVKFLIQLPVAQIDLIEVKQKYRGFLPMLSCSLWIFCQFIVTYLKITQFTQVLCRKLSGFSIPTIFQKLLMQDVLTQVRQMHVRSLMEHGWLRRPHSRSCPINYVIAIIQNQLVKHKIIYQV